MINSGRAAELILTGDLIDANEALRIGLINKIFSSEELIIKTTKFAENISSKGQIAVRKALLAIVSCNELSESDGLNYEATLFEESCSSEDFKEGTKAFLEKRKPIFKNI